MHLAGQTWREHPTSTLKVPLFDIWSVASGNQAATSGQKKKKKTRRNAINTKKYVPRGER